jgi:hypothetical protein
MADYIPRTDADLDNWQANTLIPYISANKVALGVSDATVTALTGAQTTWNTAYAAHQLAQSTATSKRQDKDAARAALVALIRSTVGQMQANPAVTDTQRAAMQITVPDTTPTPAPVPTTRPVGKIDTSERLRHTIEFRDEATPTSRAKPAGVSACELWLFVGTTAPTGPEAMHLQAVDRSTPYLMEFESSDAGKTAWWALRWVNTRGEHGP